MDKISFRMSTPDDFEGIVKIVGDYIPGVDSMGEIYPSLMSESSFYGAVGEADGKIVAFGGAYVTLGGKKLNSFGGRVHENWRKLGVYKKLKEFFRNQLKEGPFPNLAYEEFMAHSDNASIDAIRNSQSYRLIFTRELLGLRKVSNDLDCSLKADGSGTHVIRTENIGVDGLRLVLADTETRLRIFPSRLHVAMKMFDPEVSEIELISKTAPPVVASYSNDNNIRVISTAGHHRSNAYVIQLHIDTELPSVEVSKHFVLHFREHLKLGLRDAEVCIIFVPEQIMSNMMDNVQISGFEEFKLMEIPLAFGFMRNI